MQINEITFDMAEALPSSSSSVKTAADILPYQFEPLRIADDSDDEWTDCNDTGEEESSDDESQRAERCDVDSEK